MRAARHAGKKPDNTPVSAETNSAMPTIIGDNVAGITFCIASVAGHAIKIIVYFSRHELLRVEKILKELKLTDHKDIVLIDARNDNKPSASKAK